MVVVPGRSPTELGSSVDHEGVVHSSVGSCLSYVWGGGGGGGKGREKEREREREREREGERESES